MSEVTARRSAAKGNAQALGPVNFDAERQRIAEQEEEALLIATATRPGGEPVLSRILVDMENLDDSIDHDTSAVQTLCDAAAELLRHPQFEQADPALRRAAKLARDLLAQAEVLLLGLRDDCSWFCEKNGAWTSIARENHARDQQRLLPQA